ncbi:SusC/RagA family TonB-linked outer membrane protein [Pedobacter nyackensis]|uniref:SusC/RagA family TonB-linked outer membrane protein n=1 Tax=Pedobacter nyackensis TaxID=475255 RepID=UPI00292E23C5|nr:SusC/RagA family TonB-linked outer membrane protein [Pedobacter nyackensis]
MRLTTVILIASILQVSAATYGQQITINRKNASLESLLKEIRTQSNYDFFYDGKIIPKNKLVDVSLKNVDINEALKKVLAGSALSYTIEGKIVTIKKQTAPTLIDKIISVLERIDVRGKVVDENGNPLPGASVFVEDSSNRTTTNEKGEFFLQNVSDNAKILIGYVGYQPLELDAARDLGTIKMKPSTGSLEEVEITFNTGYEKIERARSAGSFAKPDMKVVMQRSTSTNILDRLEGLVGGFSSGRAQSGGLAIRGTTTTGSVDPTRVQYVSSSPLIVVDGIVTSYDAEGGDIGNAISRINPQDIEDVTFLKDATAASIWGAKAANGVIVITTKRGKAGDKLNIVYDGYYAFQGRSNRNYLPVLNTRDFISTEREIFALDAAATTYGSETIGGILTPHRQILWDRQRGLLTEAQSNFKLDSLSDLDNWGQLDNILIRDAAQYNQTISISGGGNVHTFYGSINHVGTRNNTPGDKNNRFKLNLRNDFTLGKRFKAYVNADLTNALTRSLGAVSTAVPRYQLYQDANGNPLTVNYAAPWPISVSAEQLADYQRRSRINLQFNPLLNRDTEYETGNNFSGRFVGGGTIDILKGLKFIGTYGYNITNNTGRTVLDESNFIVRRDVARFTVAPTVAATPVYYLPQFGGRLTSENDQERGWTIRNQMSYNLDWKQSQLSIMAGQEATHSQGYSASAIYYGWDDQLQISRPVDLQRLATGINGIGGRVNLEGNNVSGGEGEIVRTTSYYATAGYTHSGKYTLNASWRIDKSNLFGLDKSAQNRPVYSFGTKWALGNEDFMKPVTWLNSLDVRLSYGITGNAPNPGISASADIFDPEANPNYVSGSGLILATPANNKLTWELTKVYNGAIDFSVLKGRLYGSVDAYLKNTSGLIGTVFTAPLTGYDSVIGNYGDMQNKGIDLSLNSVNLRTENFQWGTRLSLGYNKNKLTKLNNTPPTTGADLVSATLLVDRPLYLLHAYNYAGLNAKGDPQARRADGSLTSLRNETLPEDILYVGITQAPWNGGLSNNFQYKSFNLGVNIVYSFGHKMRDPLNGLRSPLERVDSINAEFLNRWKVAGDENRTDIPRYVASEEESEERFTGYYTNANTRILDASYAKIRDITLSYGVPAAFARKLNVQGINFRVQMNDLLIWTANDKFYDPENGSSRSRAAQGTVTLGANITF